MGIRLGAGSGGQADVATPGTGRDWRAEILAFFPPDLARVLSGLDAELAACALELRVRLARPLSLVCARGDCLLDARGRPAPTVGEAFFPNRRHLEALVDSLTGGSRYAVEQQLRQGYLTLPGGHRAGFSGRTVLGADAAVRTLTDIASVNLRVARAVYGAARPVLPRLLRREDGRIRLASVLVISPPGAGKTTLLRDLARLASTGVPDAGLEGQQVVIVDERSEIAGCYQGVPQHDVGPRTDVLDGCPKAEGILWAIRALNPDVLVTDEIGAAGDANALLRACHTGIALVASAHAADPARARRRSGLQELLDRGAFDRIVTLSSRLGPGTVESVEEVGRAS